jgi:hypothetical protein
MTSYFADFVNFVGAHPHYALTAVFLLALSEAIPVIGTVVPGSTLIVGISALATAVDVNPWLLLVAATGGVLAWTAISPGDSPGLAAKSVSDRGGQSRHDPGSRSAASTSHWLDQRSHDFSRDWLRRERVGQDGLFLRYPSLDPKECYLGEQGRFRPSRQADTGLGAQGRCRRRSARVVVVAGQDQVVHGAACRSRHEGTASERGLEDRAAGDRRAPYRGVAYEGRR